MIAKRVFLILVIAALAVSPITIGHAQQGADDNAASIEAAKVKNAANLRFLTGSWVFTITAPGMPPFNSLFTFNEDGGLVSSGAVIVPFPPPIGRAIFSASHGEWQRIKNGEFAFTFVTLIHNEDAVLVGTSTVSGRLRVNDTMTSLTGSAHACDFDPNGNVLFCFDGTIQGERIVVNASGQ